MFDPAEKVIARARADGLFALGRQSRLIMNLRSSSVPGQPRRYAVRWLIALLMVGFTATIVIAVQSRVFSADGPWRWLYRLHDELWLPLVGNTWYANFPYSLFFWIPCTVVVAHIVVSMLTGVSPARALQARVVEWLASRTRGARLLLLSHRLAGTGRFRARFVEQTVQDVVARNVEHIKLSRLSSGVVPTKGDEIAFLQRTGITTWLHHDLQLRIAPPAGVFAKTLETNAVLQEAIQRQSKANISGKNRARTKAPKRHSKRDSKQRPKLLSAQLLTDLAARLPVVDADAKDVPEHQVVPHAEHESAIQSGCFSDASVAADLRHYLGATYASTDNQTARAEYELTLRRYIRVLSDVRADLEALWLGREPRYAYKVDLEQVSSAAVATALVAALDAARRWSTPTLALTLLEAFDALLVVADGTMLERGSIHAVRSGSNQFSPDALLHSAGAQHLRFAKCCDEAARLVDLRYFALCFEDYRLAQSVARREVGRGLTSAIIDDREWREVVWRQREIGLAAGSDATFGITRSTLS